MPVSSLKATFTTLVDYISLIQNPLERATKILRAIAWYVYKVYSYGFVMFSNVIRFCINDNALELHYLEKKLQAYNVYCSKALTADVSYSL